MNFRWIGIGSNLDFSKLFAANKTTSCGLIKVCKTFIRRFDSDPRLQQLALFPDFGSFLDTIYFPPPHHFGLSASANAT